MTTVRRTGAAARTAAFRPLLSWLLGVVLVAVRVSPLRAQGTAAQYATEQVFYRNAQDSTYLTATLALPRGAGPHAGLVLLSIAGTNELVEHLTALGYAVLLPNRRGFVEVEPLLQSTYQDLADDALAALSYLRARPDVDDRALAVIGQSDDAPPAMMAAVSSPEAFPLVLLAPPGFPGTEMFRQEQRGLAETDGARPEQLEALDRFVTQIASTVLSESTASTREYRLQLLMGSSTVSLPYNAAFPNDERQIHFFATPLWHDRLAFEPENVLARLPGPVLLMIGNEDASTPLLEYLAAVRRGLSAGAVQDASVCLVQGRTRHSFTRPEIEAIGTWLRARVRAAGVAPGAPTVALQGCLPDPPGR